MHGAKTLRRALGIAVEHHRMAVQCGREDIDVRGQELEAVAAQIHVSNDLLVEQHLVGKGGAPEAWVTPPR